MAKADRCSRNFDPVGAKAWEDRAQFKLDELKSKGPTLREKIKEKIEQEMNLKSFVPLGEAGLN